MNLSCCRGTMERRQLAVREGPVWHTDLAKLLAELAPQSPVREVEDREDVPLEPRPMDGGSGLEVKGLIAWIPPAKEKELSAKGAPAGVRELLRGAAAAL